MDPGRIAQVAEPGGLTLDREVEITGSEPARTDHLGPCAEVDGLSVGWTRPTSPLGAGRLSW
ncbi:MAG TPA: hypothetical protein VMY16_08155 [Ilumatobacteraceae bacterium]|nr:hypothetical protein [Ilumatobacteraceae bacterium]